jgi:hypothetical protein
MTFLESLQAHIGGLVQLKTQLFWYGGRRIEKNSGRVCLLLAADDEPPGGRRHADAEVTGLGVPRAEAIATLLIIDGQPKWIWVADKFVDLL